MKPINIGVCLIIQDEKGQVLLGKRKTGYQSGTYGLPGGRVNYSEPLAQAALRELQEETGLIGYEVNYLGVVRETQEKQEFIHFVLNCPDYDGQPENTEPDKCEGWDWHQTHDLPQPILPGHELAIELITNHHSQFNLRDAVK